MVLDDLIIVVCSSVDLSLIVQWSICLNRDELSRFVANKRGLTSLKMEGCSNLGGFSLSSSSLSTLWLSDLHSLSKMVIEVPFFSHFYSSGREFANLNCNIFCFVRSSTVQILRKYHLNFLAKKMIQLIL
jgi:hypothetical protein